MIRSRSLDTCATPKSCFTTELSTCNRVRSYPCPERSRNLAGFTGRGYEVGRGRFTQILWLAVSGSVFMRWWCPARIRVAILRAFGASVGTGVLVRHRVRIHWPWKLRVGDHSWIGEGAWLLNLEEIQIGSNVCVSQEVLLCTGSHDPRSPTFEFDNGPICIDDGVWIAARATILRGVTLGRGTTVGSGAVVRHSVPSDSFIQAANTLCWQNADDAGDANRAATQYSALRGRRGGCSSHAIRGIAGTRLQDIVCVRLRRARRSVCVRGALRCVAANAAVSCRRKSPFVRP